MKLTDALMGAADRAPIDHVRISTTATTGRIRRARAIRKGANGLAGVGAVALIAVAAIGPLAPSGSDSSAFSMTSSSTADGAPEIAMEDIPAGAQSDIAGAESADSWMCGTEMAALEDTWQWGDPSGVTYTAAEPERDGEEVHLPNTLTAHRTVDLVTGAPDHVVTWNGIIVGARLDPESAQYGPATDVELPEYQVFERLEPGTDFATLEQWTTLNAVNCWDGEPLPAGDYEVHQAWTLGYASTALAEEPDHVDGVTDGSPADHDGSAQAPALFRVAAAPVTLTVDGIADDNPFEEYLSGIAPLPGPKPPQPQPGEALSEGYLTPDQAREMFNANLATTDWDMAAGSQRWVKIHDSKNAGDQSDWDNNYFGCVWGNEGRTRFPERSAVMNLLDVNITIPSRIAVSYGFVVDGNPRVTSSITNISEYTLPGFWAGAAPQLHLVRDGQVVATAHPQDLSRVDAIAIMDSPPGTETTMVLPHELDGVLAPGTTFSGDYLWRDVNGCGTAAGPAHVAPGTYTVLAVHSVSVTHNSEIVTPVIPEAQERGVDSGAASPSLSGLSMPEAIVNFDGTVAHHGLRSAVKEPVISFDTVEPAPVTILPAPVGEWDSVELQGWTSLGTVTIR